MRQLSRAGRRSGAGRRPRARAVQARADRSGADRHHPEGHPRHGDAGHQLQRRAGRARRGLPALGGGLEARRLPWRATRREARRCSTARARARAAIASGPPARASVPSSSGIGLLRRAAELEQSLVEPDADVQVTNRTYRVVGKDGAVTTGRLLNLDSFSVQLLDTKEQLRSFVKSDLREHGFAPSPMPSYRDAAERAGDCRRRQLPRVTQGEDHPMTARVLVFVRAGRRRAAGAGHVRPHPPGRQGTAELVQLFGDAVQPAPQPADADHARQRQEPRAAVGVAVAVAREIRGDVDRGGRRALHRAGAQRRRGARRGHRPSLLDLHLREPAGRAQLLRARQPRRRGARRPRLHGHARRAPAGARRQDRQDGVEDAGGQDRRSVRNYASRRRS